jgi:multicomponent Na+:H+ antiporter subunit B
MLIGGGLLVAVLSGLLPMLLGLPFLTGLWYPYEVPAIHKVGTPLLFDVGVYLVVIGVVLTIVFSLAEE